MNPKEYVDLSLKIMPEVVKTLKTKMEAFQQEAGGELMQDPFGFMQKLMEMMMEAIMPFEDEIKASGLSVEDFNDYGNVHEAELEEFLATDPDLKEKIDSFKDELENIMKPT